MPQHGADRFKGDARKPENKVGNLYPIFKILEESGHRLSRAAKHPRAAHTLGVTLNGWTRGPINHSIVVDLA